jgi:hypothetical protein
MEELIVGSLAVCMFGLFVGLIYWGVTSDNEKRDRFMTECQQDRKRYECDAMWRAGDSQVTPAIVIPVGR